MNARSIHSRTSSQRGQAAVFLALSLTVMFGILGLVVDVGWAYFRKLACKTAAEAAAMAAAKAASSPYSSISLTPESCSTLSSGPLYVGCQYATANGITDGGLGGRQSVKMAAGTSSSPVSGITGISYWVSATVSERVPRWFTSVLGSASMTPAARATASIIATGGGCIYALGTTGIDVQVSGSAVLTSGCGIYSNSSSSNSVYMTGSSKIVTSGGTKTNIVGGYTFSPVTGGPSISPAAVTGVTAAPDPVGPNLPAAPTAGTCTSFPDLSSGSAAYTLVQGTYCTVVAIGGSRTVTMSGGTYYFENGLSVGNSGKLLESAPVTLYFAGTTGSLTATGSGTINITAPSSGTYSGILIWQPVTNITSASFGNSASATLNGVAYLPGAQFVNSGSSPTWTNFSLVAKSYSIAGSATIDSPGTSPYYTGGGLNGRFFIEE